MSISRAILSAEVLAAALLIAAQSVWGTGALIAAEGPDLPSAEFKPLPPGTKVTFSDRVYVVDRTEGYRTVFKARELGKQSWLGRMPNQETWLTTFAVFGETANNLHVFDSRGATIAYEIDSENQAKLNALWPLKVGKKTEFKVKEGGGDCTDPDNWAVSLEVVGADTVRIAEFDYPTYVIKEYGKSESGKEYRGRRWYQPDAGLVIKAQREWVKSFTVKPMMADAMGLGSMGGFGMGGFGGGPIGGHPCVGTPDVKEPTFAQGAEDNYALSAVAFPEGTTAVALKGTKVGAAADKLLAEVRSLEQEVAQARAARGLAAGKLPPDAEGVAFGDYHALVIGIDNYKELPKLKTAVNDAKAVAEVLEKHYGFTVKLLVDADRTTIVDALDEFRERLGAKDNLVIYYAGHGWLDREADQGYWLPRDAQPKRRSHWVSNATITDTLRTLRAKHVIIVADSCYSGTLTRSANVGLRSGDYWRRMAAKAARVAMVSGGLEPVVDKGDAGHSPFAKAFIHALKSNDAVIDGMQLFSAIRRPVMVAAEQTPQYSDVRDSGHDGGDFLFVRTR